MKKKMHDFEEGLLLSGDERSSSVGLSPLYVGLGSRAPPGFVGYFDEDRGEVYGFYERTGECSYGVGADGDVFAVDFRNVLWVPVAEASNLLVRGERFVEKSGVPRVFADKEAAAVALQSCVRRSQAWSRTVDWVCSQYLKRYDASSGFYYYERRWISETQWHKPVLLLGTRRRRGLDAALVDVPLEEEDNDLEGGLEDLSSYVNEEKIDYGDGRRREKAEEEFFSRQQPEEKEDENFFLRGPYCCRVGRGKKTALVAMTKVPSLVPSLRCKPSVEVPLFLNNTDIEATKWDLGDVVQCYDGLHVKRVCVDPYMLARGAAARGPMEIVRLMQRQGKRLDVLYFCLLGIAKCEFFEAEDGSCTREAKSCVLQTLKTFQRHATVPAIAAASLTALACLAENYASRSVINADRDWCRLAVSAMTNLAFETAEVIDRVAIAGQREGQQQILEQASKRFLRTPTSRSCDLAVAGCRLFGAMANDLDKREDYAEDAIRACLSVMHDCEHDANVQAAACRCLFNVVYRCEAASIVADTTKATHAVHKAIDTFCADQDFMAIAERARNVLLPNGWRGQQ